MRIFAAVSTMAVLAFCLKSFPTPRAEAQSSDRIEIVTDQAAGIARIVIDGNEVARFTAEGLVVEGNVTYGGMMIDQGSAAFNRDSSR